MANHPFHGTWRCVILTLIDGTITPGTCELDIEPNGTFRKGTYAHFGEAPRELSAVTPVTENEILLNVAGTKEHLQGFIVRELSFPVSKWLAGFFFVAQDDAERELKLKTRNALTGQDDGTWHGTNP